MKDEEFPVYFSKIIYGIVPKFYHGIGPVFEITKGDLFDVSRINIPSEYHKKAVYFSILDCQKPGLKECEKKVNSNGIISGLKLAGCDNNDEKTCLFTNSPAPPDIEDKYKKIIGSSLTD